MLGGIHNLSNSGGFCEANAAITPLILREESPATALVSPSYSNLRSLITACICP